MRFFSKSRKPQDEPAPEENSFLEAMSECHAIAWFDRSVRVLEPVRVVKYAIDITPRIRAVTELRRGLEQLADGDLSSTITTEFSEDFEPLRQDFNSAVNWLRTTIQKVVSASSELDAGTTEITNASNDLSRRTES